MKNFRKIGLAMVTLMLTMFLTACGAGSTIDTVLALNPDLSGQRTMTLVVNDEIFDEYFDGTVDDLNNLIVANCPADLSYTYDESTGSKVYTFNLVFTDPDDYKQKVDRIIGEESDQKLIITAENNVWSNGIYIDEGFSSSDLLSWFSQAIVDAGYINSSNASRVFTNGSSSVFYGGQTYESYSYISVDQMESVEIDGFYFYTDAYAENMYDKKIELYIDQDSMDAKGAEIKTWLESHLPAGATAEWSTKDYSSVYTVSKKGMTLEEMQTFLNEFFDSNECTVVENEVTEGYSPFTFNKHLVETVDVSTFLSETGWVDFEYRVLGHDGYIGGSYLGDLYYYGDTTEYNWCSGNVNGLDVTFESYYQKAYKVKEAIVESKVGLFGKLEREITFALAQEPTKEEQKAIVERIEKVQEQEEILETEIATETTEPVEEPVKWKISVNDKTKNGTYTVTIKQKGSREQIQASSEALFGYAGDMYVADKHNFAALNNEMSVVDEFTLGKYLYYTTDDYNFTYTLNSGFLSEIEYTSYAMNARVDGNEATITGPGYNGMNIVVYGTQFNVWALLFYALIIIALGAAFLVLKKEGIIDALLSKANANKPVAAAAPAPTATTVETAVPQNEVVEEKPMFCEKCGAPRDNDALVCTNCGTKFED